MKNEKIEKIKNEKIKQNRKTKHNSHYNSSGPLFKSFF